MRAVLLALRDKDTLGEVRLILRGCKSAVEALTADLRFDHRRYAIEVDGPSCFAFTVVPPGVGRDAVPSFKAFLRGMEDGVLSSECYVATGQSFPDSLYQVTTVYSSYETLLLSEPMLASVAESNGSPAQWEQLQQEIAQGSFREICDQFPVDFLSAFDAFAFGHEYRSWVYYIHCKARTDEIQDAYLHLVLCQTKRFEDFRHIFLHALLDVPTDDKKFPIYYAQRKARLKVFSEADLADYANAAKIHRANAVRYLTDTTLSERKAIIAIIATYKTVPEESVLREIYPVLNAWLRANAYYSPTQTKLLTDYFADYKHQKLLNEIEPAFAEHVLRLAQERPYNSLSAREELIFAVPKSKTLLYWVDALGVEYLGFVQDYCHKNGLSITTRIGAAQLPTLTHMNKRFYDTGTAPSVTMKCSTK
jgi:hypothetical protein